MHAICLCCCVLVASPVSVYLSSRVVICHPYAAAAAVATAAAETQDVEESTSCVVVTLVMLAQGTVSMPSDVIRDVQTFKNAMKQVCGPIADATAAG